MLIDIYLLLVIIHMATYLDFTSYKELILAKISSLPDKGRGTVQRLAEHLRVNPSFVSQVLKGDKHFSSEQVFSATRFFSLPPVERDFLIGLHQWERAGTHELKQHYKELLDKIKIKSQQVSKHIAKKTILSETDQARFYSDWIYSALRLFCTTEKVNLKKICDRFQLSSSKATEIIDFLLSVGLIKTDGAYFTIGVTNTHLPANSPYIASHHKNWRVRAMNKHTQLGEDELAFSAPLGISKADFAKVKLEILELISRVSRRVNDSPTEDLACLNIDLFYL